MGYYSQIDNNEETREIRLGGIPLTLYRYSEQIFNPLNETMGVEKLETIYAIGIISKNNISPINPSSPKEISFTWHGNRYVASQDIDGKLYISIARIGIPTPIDMTIIEGIPIGIGEDRQLAFQDSGMSEDDIEEYFSATIGGVPLSIGRIGNKYYLIAYTIDTREFK